MNLKPGDLIHNYRVIRFIPGGGMGQVYEAEDTFLGRKVALKTMDPAITHDEQFKQRFLNEARIQSQLHHPNIVQLITFFEEADTYVMVLEFAEGISLRDLISQTGPIVEERSRHLFYQIMLALQYAHGKGVIHRDIKPSNIMVSANDEVKILDFGIARMMGASHLTSTGSRVGTIFYMSPEQVLGQKDVDHRSDIYSSGIVLYEMLTGALPYNTSTDSNFLLEKEIVEKPVPDPRAVYGGISNAMVHLVFTMTAKTPAQRPEIPQILDIMQHGVAETPRPQTQTAPKPKPAAAPQPKPKKKKTGTAIFFTLMAIVLLIFASWFYYRYTMDGEFPIFGKNSEEISQSDEEKAQELADDADYATLMDDYPESEAAQALLLENGEVQYPQITFFPFIPNRSYTYALIRNVGDEMTDGYVDKHTLNTGEHFSRLVDNNGEWVLGDILPLTGDAQLMEDLERVFLGPSAAVNRGFVSLGGFYSSDSSTPSFEGGIDSYIQIGTDVWLGYEEEGVYHTRYLIYSTATPVRMGELECLRSNRPGNQGSGRYYAEIYWGFYDSNVRSYWQTKTGASPSSPSKLLCFDAINSLDANAGILRNQEYTGTREAWDDYWGEWGSETYSFTLFGTNDIYAWSALYAENKGLYILTVDSYHGARHSSAYILLK